MRDIARRAGVSAVSVHKALYAKEGVGESTRKRILDIADNMNYSVNVAASSLKRKATHIAVILRSKSSSHNYFFRKMWDGIDRAECQLWDYRVRISRMGCGDDWEDQDEILRNLARSHEVDGVILHCWDETRLNPAIDLLYEKGIPVVTTNSDAPGSKRLACVSAPNERVGMLAAETLSLLSPYGSKALVAGGIRPADNLHANRRGFSSYMRERSPDTSIAKIYNLGDKDRFKTDLAEALKNTPGISGIYAITAGDTVNVCETVREIGLSGRVKVVGSDVFEEMRPFFEDGTLHASIWKDQQSQA